MNELMIFEGHEVEVFELEGKVLFNPYHVAECLGIKNIRDNIANMNEKQVIKLTNSTVGNTDIRKLNNAGENFLTESGVYKLIFKSRKEEAERFQDWVTDEVLPSIRKNGGYVAPEVREKLDRIMNDYSKGKLDNKLDSSLEELVYTFSRLLGDEDKKYVELVNRMLGDKIDQIIRLSNK